MNIVRAGLITRLDPRVAADLATADLTYAGVGDSAAGIVPAGFTGLHRAGLLDISFDDARDALFRWQVQLRSGVAVASNSPVIVRDAVAELAVGFGPLRLSAPVRVTAVVDEPRAAAFAYGTLPGHPECGEEHFRVWLDDADRVRFSIDGFSKPSGPVRLVAPVASIIQSLITNRYVRSLRTAV